MTLLISLRLWHMFDLKWDKYYTSGKFTFINSMKHVHSINTRIDIVKPQLRHREPEPAQQFRSGHWKARDQVGKFPYEIVHCSTSDKSESISRSVQDEENYFKRGKLKITTQPTNAKR